MASFAQKLTNFWFARITQKKLPKKRKNVLRFMRKSLQKIHLSKKYCHFVETQINNKILETIFVKYNKNCSD